LETSWIGNPWDLWQDSLKDGAQPVSVKAVEKKISVDPADSTQLGDQSYTCLFSDPNYTHTYNGLPNNYDADKSYRDAMGCEYYQISFQYCGNGNLPNNWDKQGERIINGFPPHGGYKTEFGFCECLERLLELRPVYRENYNKGFSKNSEYWIETLA